MVTQLVGRAPLFDDEAKPALYRVMTRGGTVDGIVDLLLGEGGRSLARGLPLLVPVPTDDLGRLAASEIAGEVWAEPLEDELDGDAVDAWRAADARLGGVVARERIGTPGHEPLLDVATAGRIHAAGLDIDDIRARSQQLRGVTTIATGVHTAELHGHVRRIGVDLVGGRYLDDVRFDHAKTMDGDRLTLLQLTAMLQQDEPSLDDVTASIEHSPTLAFEVMRWVNSSFIGLNHRIDDIRRAVGLLGPKRLTQIVSLMIAREMNDRPRELYRSALVRARMCERVAADLASPPHAAYVVGLFSQLPSLLERPIEEIVTQLPLSDDIEAALRSHEGRLGRILQAAKLYENALFDDPVLVSLDPVLVSSAYMDAIVFADQLMSSAAAEPEPAPA